MHGASYAFGDGLHLIVESVRLLTAAFLERSAILHAKAQGVRAAGSWDLLARQQPRVSVAARQVRTVRDAVPKAVVKM